MEPVQEMAYANSESRAVTQSKPVRVNGVLIDENEIFREAQNHPDSSWEAACEAAAKALVVRQLLLQEARALAIEPASPPNSTDQESMEEEALIQALIDSSIEVPVAGREECHCYYTNNPDKFQDGPWFHARHILIRIDSADEDGLQSSRSQAEQIIRLLQANPERFPELAGRYSVCPSATSGGELGRIGRGDTAPRFEQALERMAPGEITPEPVMTRYGFHVIALDQRDEGGLLPFEDVSERISAWLGASAWARAASQYIGLLAAKADIEGCEIKAADSVLVQ